MSTVLTVQIKYFQDQSMGVEARDLFQEGLFTLLLPAQTKSLE